MDYLHGHGVSPARVAGELHIEWLEVERLFVPVVIVVFSLALRCTNVLLDAAHGHSLLRLPVNIVVRVDATLVVGAAEDDDVHV